MLGWLIEIRNFFLALTLAWVGISLAAEKPTETKQAVQLKPTVEATAAATGKCPSARRH